MNLLETYIRDISRYQPITQEQETYLALRARQGDTQARNQLIQAHLRLVVNIARQHLRAGVEMLDLIQEGNIGLIQAVDLFDPTQGNRLSSLAMFWVQKYILRFLRDLQEENLSLDMQISDYTETLLLSDTIEDKGNRMGDQTIKNIETIMEHKELQEHLGTLQNQLTPHEQQVLQLLYGLNGNPTMERREIAQVMGVQIDQVSRIKTRALKRLKNLYLAKR
jgi:RNA polymerase sigma factor (sigma-70 family)